MVVPIIIVIYIFMSFRAYYLFKKSMRLLDAVLKYQLTCIHELKQWNVDFKDIKDATSFKVLIRIWDWSCTSLVSKEKFELIKPFMEGQKK